VLGGSKIPWFNLAYVRFVGQKSELFIRELAEHSKIPVINAMTKKYHPLQGITDIFTLLEEWKYFEGTPIHGKQITYFGLGNNNVTHSAMLAASAIGINFLLICPQKKNYLPAEDVLEKALAFSKKSGSQITINDSAKIADTDAVFTDTHAMGDTTAEKIHTKKILAPYVVDNEKTRLFKNPNWIFLHCMPIHVKPDNTDYEEVSQSIADGPHSRIFQEAENRLYAIMALLYCFTQRGFFAI
jgi:ornithine carbamoyltransferase